MKKSTNTSTNSRHFVVRQYPRFGRDGYSEASPPDGVLNSPFYWWFRFLQLNDEYEKAFNGKRSTISRQVVKDFGRVRNVSFKQWWSTHSNLFVEPATAYRMMVATHANELAPFDSKDAVNLVIPLNWTSTGLKRRFSQIVDRWVAEGRVRRNERGFNAGLSQATYRISRKWSIQAFKNAYAVYSVIKQAEMKGERLYRADAGIRAKLSVANGLSEGQKTVQTLDGRAKLTILARRHYLRAVNFIAASATNSFPTANEHADQT